MSVFSITQGTVCTCVAPTITCRSTPTRRARQISIFRCSMPRLWCSARWRALARGLTSSILDACRNNPFGGRGLRASGGGLAQMQAPEGTLISYATQPGNVAQDGDNPYTKALAATMRTPGLDIFQTFNEVGLQVKRATSGSQQPWVASSPIEALSFLVLRRKLRPPYVRLRRLRCPKQNPSSYVCRRLRWQRHRDHAPSMRAAVAQAT